MSQPTEQEWAALAQAAEQVMPLFDALEQMRKAAGQDLSESEQALIGTFCWNLDCVQAQLEGRAVETTRTVKVFVAGGVVQSVETVNGVDVEVQEREDDQADEYDVVTFHADGTIDRVNGIQDPGAMPHEEWTPPDPDRCPSCESQSRTVYPDGVHQCAECGCSWVLQ